jgi:hypothetical protein
MPKLMLFVPCQHVAYDAADQSPTLIGVFQGFTISLVLLQEKSKEITTATIETMTEGTPSAIPIRWAAFAMWRKLPEDGDKTFTQICELLKPNGESSAKQSMTFKMTQNFQRNTVQFHNFPIDQEGDYPLRFFLQEGDGEPRLISEYPVQIIHNIKSKEQA